MHRLRSRGRLLGSAVATKQDWTRDGFTAARYCFDPESAGFRTRYAASTLVGAFRERYARPG